MVSCNVAAAEAKSKLKCRCTGVYDWCHACADEPVGIVGYKDGVKTYE